MAKGHDVHSFTQLPPKAWWSVIKQVYTKIQEHNLSLIAAGVAFYFLLAIFPLLAGIISLYGLLVTPENLQAHMNTLLEAVPQESRDILQEQMRNLMEKSDATLGSGVLLSLLITVWSSSKGANALITACNITYYESTHRGFFRAILARMGFTLSGIAIIVFALLAMTVLPDLISWLGGYKLSDTEAKWITWPALIVMFNATLAALYRYGPHRKKAKWRWVTVGSCSATVLWLLATFAFSWYLQSFGAYDKTYGSVGGIIVLLMWMYISAFIILLGAEINSAIELQTTEDSTVGEDQPMGERGAFVADNTPEGLKEKRK
ncbi:YihY/virulence factor BrkB family protein [Alteromonas sp. ASW11-19]|uniref:YihY/virulence factor BrkB family protein n=1 Tax=Alteromonas salexigens TaxID=2982530 RepID=A0ABT2VJ49_9ALTE|nr:YihY/virulence factor BrkB family protein [Alteromonas salexigens]MCU7553069.1 YihY/virulence factor BrkB family protein [Alteromonas salexigens]